MNAVDHIKKLNSNKEFAAFLDDKPYKDWQVTAIFYCALHLVNAYLHLDRTYHVKDIAIKTHKATRDYLKSIERNDLYDLYTALYSLSCASRYSLEDVSLRVEVAKRYFTNLEKLCVIKLN